MSARRRTEVLEKIGPVVINVLAWAAGALLVAPAVLVALIPVLG